ncbi:USE1 family protein [Abortiporus biennis]
MVVQTSEQLNHDRINLARLVRSLQATVSKGEWDTNSEKPGGIGWIKIQGLAQNLKYAHKLLSNVEQHHDLTHASTSWSLQDTKNILDNLDLRISELSKRLKPISVRPQPILPTLPTPIFPLSTEEVRPASPHAQQSPETLAAPLSAQDLLLSPSDSAVISPLEPKSASTLLPVETVLPSKSKASASTSLLKAQPAFMQNSASLHEELSEQLAQMATQLKRNTMHFAASLEKDKDVVLDAQGKLDKNFDVMTKERVRLRDHSSKSWGTTWITLLSVIVALVGFILTFFVIRIT